MEAELSGLIGAGGGERAPEERLTDRNGYRRCGRRGRASSSWIPKLRRGSYFQVSWSPRKRSEQALV
jgi:transposase-like protein